MEIRINGNKSEATARSEHGDLAPAHRLPLPRRCIGTATSHALQHDTTWYGSFKLINFNLYLIITEQTYLTLRGYHALKLLMKQLLDSNQNKIFTFFY